MYNRTINHSIPHLTAVLLLLAGLLLGGSAGAQSCTCDDTGNEICNDQGFGISLVEWSVGQGSGSGDWDYEVCNGKNQNGSCPLPKDPKGLSHVDLSLPGLGSCLTPDAMVTLTQTGGFQNAQLDCEVGFKDPSCGIQGQKGQDFVAKCDVADGSNLGPGQCVTIRLSITGGQPDLTTGVAWVVTKAGPSCTTDCILGPACESCNQPPPVGDFRTQTQGGWGTTCHGNNPGCYRDAHFSTCFPQGLVAGESGDESHTLTLTDSAAVENFLPQGGPPNSLKQSYVDPLSTEAGVLGGQVAALTLNVDFDRCDPDFGSSSTALGDLVVCPDQTPCTGMTVDEILAEANAVLGGTGSTNPSTINQCASKVNENFVDGTVVGPYLCLP